MRNDVYQIAAMRYCQHPPGSQQCLIDAVMGLASEAGEVVGLVKKTVFAGHPMDKDKLILELGDALWNLTEACYGLGISLDEVMMKNIQKLEARYPAGKFTTKDSMQRKDAT